VTRTLLFSCQTHTKESFIQGDETVAGHFRALPIGKEPPPPLHGRRF
jgi:hypothetical protein